jgi:hypothetical protein
MLDELFQMMVGGGRHWVEAAFLISLFLIATGRPERIRSVGQFRAACLIFAASLFAPTLTNLYMLSENMGGGGPGAMRFGGADSAFALLLMAVGPMLFALAFLLAIDSVTPRKRRVDEAAADAPARRIETE